MPMLIRIILADHLMIITHAIRMDITARDQQHSYIAQCEARNKDNISRLFLFLTLRINIRDACCQPIRIYVNPDHF